MHLPDRGRDLRPGRVEHRDQSDQAQVPFGVLPLAGDWQAGGQRSVAEREHAQALPRVVVHGPGGSVPVRGRDRRLVRAAADPGRPGQDLLGRALGVRDQATVLLVHGGHQLDPRIEPEQRPAHGLPAPRRHVQAAGRGQLEQGHLGRVPGRGSVPGQLGRAAGEGDLGQRAEARGRDPGRPGPRGRVFQARLTVGRPGPGDAHPVLGERAGLVGADDRRGPERLHRGQPLDQGTPAGHLPHPDRQRERDRGQQPFRDVRYQQPDREADRGGQAQPGGQADRQERQAGADRDERNQPGRPLDLVLERALLAPDALAQRGDAAELGAHPGRGDHGLRLAARALAPAEHQVPGPAAAEPGRPGRRPTG